MTSLPITVIILTYNESNNITDCLDSVKGMTDDIILVDSGSTDDTLHKASAYNPSIYHHPFENYSKQRNWAFDNVSTKYEWILNMDADHRLTSEIVAELATWFGKGIPADVNGFMASRRTMFLGRWIKYGGHYPVYHGIIFRKGFGACEDKEYDQHFMIEGKSILLKSDVIDIITDSLTNFIARHNKWATLEANDILNIGSAENKIVPNKNGNMMEKRRYQRMKYYSYPLFWRVFLYFFYRFLLKGGFRDGKPGLIFHFLQGFWFRFLVDSKIYELKKAELK
ncbi:MAG: glycosyltransferase family 2 protein [Flavobacterium sp.]|nr:MAG: glycosyltransferase family 2 protein [Flavobacterium sp.]